MNGPHQRFAWFLAIGLAVAPAGCGSQEGGAAGGAASVKNAAVAAGGAAVDLKPEGRILAHVGEGGVTEQTFQTAASRTPPGNGVALSDEEKRDVLEQLITEEALFQEAARRGMHHDPKVRKIMVNLLLRQEIYGNVKATDFGHAELRAYYDEHKEDFIVPEKVQIKRIFLTIDHDLPRDAAIAKARQLRDQLTANPDKFKDVALEHSEGPMKRRGGDLGFLSREGKPGIDPEVVKTAFELEVGGFSEPFESGGGINLVHAANRRDRVERSYEQMKGSVLRRLKNDRYKGLTDTFVQSVRDGISVEVDELLLFSTPIGPEAAKRADPDAPGAPPAPGVPATPGAPTTPTAPAGH